MKSSTAATVLLTLLSGTLLWIFPIGRAGTKFQFYSGILTTWAILATVCSFTVYRWIRLFSTRRKALIPSIVVWLIVGTIYTAMDISVMLKRQRTAEQNIRQDLLNRPDFPGIADGEILIMTRSAGNALLIIKNQTMGPENMDYILYLPNKSGEFDLTTPSVIRRDVSVVDEPPLGLGWSGAMQGIGYVYPPPMQNAASKPDDLKVYRTRTRDLQAVRLDFDNIPYKSIGIDFDSIPFLQTTQW